MGWKDERDIFQQELNKAIEGVPASFEARLFALLLVADRFQAEKLYNCFPVQVLFFREWKEGKNADQEGNV